MCSHFTPTQRSQWFKEKLGAELPTEFPPETFPSYLAPVIVQSRQSGRVACGLARFGLIPPWAKDDKMGRHTYNARSETVHQKPSFRGAWRQGQYGLVPVDRFFEPSYQSGKAVAWPIELATGEPFAIACLWERWLDSRREEVVVSFSLLTVNADHHPLMSQCHRPSEEKRSPLIVPAERYADWLSASEPEAAKLVQEFRLPDLVRQVSNAD